MDIGGGPTRNELLDEIEVEARQDAVRLLAHGREPSSAFLAGASQSALIRILDRHGLRALQLPLLRDELRGRYEEGLRRNLGSRSL